MTKKASKKATAKAAPPRAPRGTVIVKPLGRTGVYAHDSARCGCRSCAYGRMLAAPVPAAVKMHTNPLLDGGVQQ